MSTHEERVDSLAIAAATAVKNHGLSILQMEAAGAAADKATADLFLAMREHSMLWRDACLRLQNKYEFLEALDDVEVGAGDDLVDVEICVTQDYEDGIA